MKNNNKGFTLIELLVVVLIIGILAAIALPQYTKTVEKSRSAEALLNLKAISDAANRNYLLSGAYVNGDGTAMNDFSGLDIDVPTTSNNFTFAFAGCAGDVCTITATRKAAGNAYVITYYLSKGGFDTTKPAAGGSGRGCADAAGGNTCPAINAMLK